MARAALDGDQELAIDSTSDGATTLKLAGEFPGYDSLQITEDGEPLCGAKASPGGVELPVKNGTHSYRITLP